MKFHKTLDLNSSSRGLTLVEITLSILILGILVGVSTPFVLEFYRRYQLDSERATLLTLLREARTMSLATESTSAHGVYIDSAHFTVYEGASYALRDTSKDQTFPRYSVVAITGGSEIVFARISGLATPTTFLLDNGTKNSNIYVNAEGSIDWD